MGKERITYLDSLKGILIILVMVGHSNPPSFIYSFIYAFHMPAFFMLSGMFVKPLQTGETKAMILKYAKAYLKPYYIVFVIVLLTTPIHLYLNDKSFTISLFVKRTMVYLLGYMGPTWFLFALFFALIVYRLLAKK